MENSYYIGTDLKFQFTISVEGSNFDIEDDDFSITVIGGNKTVTWDKKDDNIIIVPHHDADPEDPSDIAVDAYGILLIPTDMIGSGPLKIVVTAKVPDDDFEHIYEDGCRREVAVQSLGTIKKIR